MGVVHGANDLGVFVVQDGDAAPLGAEVAGADEPARADLLHERLGAAPEHEEVGGEDVLFVELGLVVDQDGYAIADHFDRPPAVGQGLERLQAHPRALDRHEVIDLARRPADGHVGGALPGGVVARIVPDEAPCPCRHRLVERRIDPQINGAAHLRGRE